MSVTPRVVAVVCTYWPTRRQNVRQILRDLYASTRRPDHVIVLNNHAEATLLNPVEGWPVTIFNAGINTTCRGKFIAALLTVADYYLLLDDDTSVGPETIARLLDYSQTEAAGWSTGYLGCWIDWAGADGPTLFSETSRREGRLWPRDAQQPTPCDTWCGCALWCDFAALTQMVALEARVRTPRQWPDEGDDLLLGLASRSVVLPLRGPEDFVPLSDGGQAMSTSIDNYYGMRDAFLRDVLRAQGRL